MWWRNNYWLTPWVFLLLALAKLGFADSGDDGLLLRIGSGNPLAGKQKSAIERCQNSSEGENEVFELAVI
jgi:hypothetical protein